MHDAGHWTFGRFTGDYNGIHLWDWYARRFGFRRGLYHPPRVLGECLARLPRLEEQDCPVRLDVWLMGFIMPVENHFVDPKFSWLGTQLAAVEMIRSTGSAKLRARMGVQLLFPKRTPRRTRS